MVLDSEISHRRAHWLGGLFLSGVLILVGLGGYLTISWMWDEERLPLSQLAIQGELRYVTPNDVQQQLATLDHIGTFMSQDVTELQKSAESLPWVAHASVRKQWPDTIKVFLVEHQPVAIWNGNGLLNLQGEVFQGDVSLLQQEVVKLYGPEASNQQVLTVYRELKPQFAQFGLVISSLLLNDRRAWQIILDNGIRLELGKESLQSRIARFFMLYQQLDQTVNRISYVDLRYDTGAAVGWYTEQELEQERQNDQSH
ncbi:cell division protein FtsQ/DivIB [Vibrio agarilyticus]